MGSPSQDAEPKPYHPLSLRIRANERAKGLRADGMSYNKIVETLRQEMGFKASKGQLSEWLRDIHGPFGSANHFSPNPVPELAYVIGVELGDGSLNRKGYNRRIRLSAIDLEFVMEFDRCLSAVLGTKRHKPWFDRKRGDYSIEARSVLLYEFMNREWKFLKPWVEHCPDCVRMFLRGFFDSEGCADEKGNVTCYNSDHALLTLIRRLLLLYFGIQTTGPHLRTRAGSKISHRGHTYFRRLNGYSLYVRANSLSRFCEEVGFSIQRKQARLENMLLMRLGPMRR